MVLLKLQTLTFNIFSILINLNYFSAGGCAADEWVSMADGSPLTYTNWATPFGYPNNQQGVKDPNNMENYIQLILTHGLDAAYDVGHNGKWNDRWSIDAKNDLPADIVKPKDTEGIANGQNNAFICVKELS